MSSIREVVAVRRPTTRVAAEQLRMLRTLIVTTILPFKGHIETRGVYLPVESMHVNE